MISAESFDFEDDEMKEFLSKIFERYGFDFTDYALASMRRRIAAVMRAERIETLGSFAQTLLSDPPSFQRFVHGVSVNVTSMFRDPNFYLAFRKHVVPVLSTYPFIRLWNAGCASGEESYSMSILLHEEGLLERSRIYATDLNPVALQQARDGIFPLANMKEYSSNYLLSGGKDSLSSFYTADGQHAILRGFLKNNILFSLHNLVSDGSFNEFHVILCRNVLIYFNNRLRSRALSLFHDSMINFGFLGLGARESLRFSEIEGCYEQIVKQQQLYKRIL